MQSIDRILLCRREESQSQWRAWINKHWVEAPCGPMFDRPDERCPDQEVGRVTHLTRRSLAVAESEASFGLNFHINSDELE